jgi:hypothetical protein
MKLVAQALRGAEKVAQALLPVRICESPAQAIRPAAMAKTAQAGVPVLLKRYALCASNIFISSAEGPYMPGTATSFMRR